MAHYHHYKNKIKTIRIITLFGSIALLLFLIFGLKDTLSCMKDTSHRLESLEGQMTRADIKIDEQQRASLYADIMKDCIKIIKQKPMHANAYLLRGEAAYKKSLLERDENIQKDLVNKTIENIRKGSALQQSEIPVEFTFYLGAAYARKGDAYLHDALFYLEYAQKNGFSQADCKKNGLPAHWLQQQLASVYYHLGNLQEALQLIDRMIKTYDTPQLHMMRGYIYKDRKEYDTAEKEFQIVVERIHDNEHLTVQERAVLYKTKYALGWLQFRKGHYTNAERYYLDAAALNPNTADTYYWLGKTYQMAKNWKMACSAWKRCLEIDDNYYPAKKRLKKYRWYR